jgi:hypothetical protein
MTITLPQSRTLRDAMLARLRLVPGIKVYGARIPQNDPPDTIPGSGGVVRPYVMLYAGGGTAYSDRACRTPSVLSWAPQISVVAGVEADCLAALDRIRAELTGTHLSITDGTTGILKEPDGERPLLVDETVSPTRFSYPLLYTIVASA